MCPKCCATMGAPRVCNPNHQEYGKEIICKQPWCIYAVKRMIESNMKKFGTPEMPKGEIEKRKKKRVEKIKLRKEMENLNGGLISGSAKTTSSQQSLPSSKLQEQTEKIETIALDEDEEMEDVEKRTPNTKKSMSTKDLKKGFFNITPKKTSDPNKISKQESDEILNNDLRKKVWRSYEPHPLAEQLISPELLKKMYPYAGDCEAATKAREKRYCKPKPNAYFLEKENLMKLVKSEEDAEICRKKVTELRKKYDDMSEEMLNSLSTSGNMILTESNDVAMVSPRKSVVTKSETICIEDTPLKKGSKSETRNDRKMEATKENDPNTINDVDMLSPATAIPKGEHSPPKEFVKPKSILKSAKKPTTKSLKPVPTNSSVQTNQDLKSLGLRPNEVSKTFGMPGTRMTRAAKKDLENIQKNSAPICIEDTPVREKKVVGKGRPKRQR